MKNLEVQDKFKIIFDNHNYNEIITKYPENFEIIDEFIYKDLKERNKNFLKENISEEVHRFVISFHRDLRSKGSLSSILDNIEDVGTKRRNLLIKKYKTVNKIKEASIEELEELIGKKATKNVKDALKEN